MDQYDQDMPMNEQLDDERQEPDRPYNSSETGLVGDTGGRAADDTSESGVAGSSTFDPRVSPAHDGLLGSPEISDEVADEVDVEVDVEVDEVDDAPYSTEQAGRPDLQDDEL